MSVELINSNKIKNEINNFSNTDAELALIGCIYGIIETMKRYLIF